VVFLNSLPTGISPRESGNGSIQRLCRLQIVQWHTVGGWGGAGEVIATTPALSREVVTPVSIALLTTAMGVSLWNSIPY